MPIRLVAGGVHAHFEARQPILARQRLTGRE